MSSGNGQNGAHGGYSSRPSCTARRPAVADASAAAAAARAGTALDVARRSRGKHILFIGTTGFVGKVALSMLLHRYPEVGKVFCLVRPGAGNTADERVLRQGRAEPRRSIRCATRHGDRLRGVHAREDRRRSPGDVSDARCCSFTDGRSRASSSRRHRRRHQQRRPRRLRRRRSRARSRINAMGAKNVVELCRASSARALVHVSTCFVAGQPRRRRLRGRAESSATSRARGRATAGRGDELLERDFDPSSARSPTARRSIERAARARPTTARCSPSFRERGARAARATSAATRTTRRRSGSRSAASASSG